MHAAMIPIATIMHRTKSGGRAGSLRHKRMSLSPWNFYRGAAAVMAADLASRPHTAWRCSSAGTPIS